MDLLQWLIHFLIKKHLVEQLKNEIIYNKELAEELHKPFRKVHSPFIDNICGADLADMKLILK